MSIHVLIVDVFDRPFDEASIDALLYIGYVKDLGGKTVNGRVQCFHIQSGLDGVHMYYMKISDANNSSPDLTVVFRGDVNEQRDALTRLMYQCADSIIRVFDMGPLAPSVKANGVANDGSASVVFENVAECLDKLSVAIIRNEMTVVQPSE